MTDVQKLAVGYIRFLELLIKSQKDFWPRLRNANALAESKALIERFRRAIAEVEREYLRDQLNPKGRDLDEKKEPQAARGRREGQAVSEPRAFSATTSVMMPTGKRPSRRRRQADGF